MGVKLVASSGGSVELVPTNTASNFTVTVPAVTASMLTDSSGVMNIGSGQIYKDSSGNVGIGVTPSAWASFSTMQVGETGCIASNAFSASNTQTFVGNNVYYDGAYKYIATGSAATQYIFIGNEHRWNIAPSGTAGNAITFTQAMTLDSSGNLLVGGTTPYISERITARAASASVQCLSAYNTFNSQSATNIYSASVTASSSGWYHFIGQSGNGTSVTTNNIIIYGNGNVQNANNSYAGISDIKLKENVVDATPKLAKLMQVRVVNYNLKADDGYESHKQIGVVAQELEQIFPSMVEETADKDAKGEDLGTTTKSVKYSVFVPMLIKAIQEQQAIITSLTDRITALENK